MVLSDILLTDTGDIFYGDDMDIAESLTLVKQNMFTFLRSESEDMPLSPSMAFSMLDYVGLPNTRRSADLVRTDFAGKVSQLEPFQGYQIDVDVFPTDVTEMKMEISITGPTGASTTMGAPIVFENGFVSNIPSKFNSDIYDTSSSVNIAERITLAARTDRIPVKYTPEINELIVFALSSAPALDSENNLSDIQTISGTIAMTSTILSMDEEISSLSGKRIESYVFDVSGEILSSTDTEIDSAYQYRIVSSDSYDVEFDQVYPSLNYTVEYQNSIAIATAIEEGEIEMPKPESLIFPFATDDKVYNVVLDRYLEAGTYIVQYRTSTVE